jgi:hypothetical protein
VASVRGGVQNTVIRRGGVPSENDLMEVLRRHDEVVLAQRMMSRRKRVCRD